MNRCYKICASLGYYFRPRIAWLANCKIVVGYGDSDETLSPFPCSSPSGAEISTRQRLADLC